MMHLIKSGLKVFIIFVFVFSHEAVAQSVSLRPSRGVKKPVLQKKSAAKKVENTSRPILSSHKPREQVGDSFEVEYKKASVLVEQGQYLNAATKLFSLLRNPGLKNRASKIRYLLGISLASLGYKQIASFQFIQSASLQDSAYKKISVQRLSEMAADLGDDTLLNYVFNNLQLKDFPESEKEALYFRLGQARYQNEDYSKALELFSRVSPSSRYAQDSEYYSGLSYSKSGNDTKAIKVYENLVSAASSLHVTHPYRIQAQLALARTHYKKQDWENSIVEYSKIPRDSEYWPEALFEQTWAMLRSGRLRSALSNFHTLHSPYYEAIFNPESLLLRSIVYLYICKYDEMEKVLSIYKKNYNTMPKDLRRASLQLEDVFSAVDEYRRGRRNIKSVLPEGILRELALQEAIQNQFYYLEKIQAERKGLVENPMIRKTSVGAYGLKVLNRRILSTEKKIALLLGEALAKIENDLVQFNEQADLIAFEMTSGKTHQLKKRISGGGVISLAEKVGRDFFVNNGYQYYPFKGEYWLDEVGNFHYFGQQGCE